MSWWIYLSETTAEERIDVSDLIVWEKNVTYNLGSMAFSVGWSFRGQANKPVEELVPAAREALDQLESDPESFRHFEPENKWGTVENLIEFFREFITAAVENPQTIMLVH